MKIQGFGALVTKLSLGHALVNSFVGAGPEVVARRRAVVADRERIYCRDRIPSHRHSCSRQNETSRDEGCPGEAGQFLGVSHLDTPADSPATPCLDYALLAAPCLAEAATTPARTPRAVKRRFSQAPAGTAGPNPRGSMLGGVLRVPWRSGKLVMVAGPQKDQPASPCQV